MFPWEALHGFLPVAPVRGLDLLDKWWVRRLACQLDTD